MSDKIFKFDRDEFAGWLFGERERGTYFCMKHREQCALCKWAESKGFRMQVDFTTYSVARISDGQFEYGYVPSWAERLQRKTVRERGMDIYTSMPASDVFIELMDIPRE